MTRAVRIAARTLWALGFVALLFATAEFGLRTFMGFGSPVLYENSYVCGYRPLPNQTTRRTARKFIRINNYGLRGSRDWVEPRPAGQLRLLYLGDSVTYGGSFVDDRETFAEVSAEKLATAVGTDVLPGNGAVNGWGPRNIHGLVNRVGCFGADVVVVVALESDLRRDLGHMAESPFWNKRPTSAIEEVLSSWIVYRFNNRRFLPKEAFVSAAERDSFVQSSISHYMSIGRLVRSTGAHVLMVWHPSRDAGTAQGRDEHRAAFLAACREAGLPCLDLEPIVRATKDPAALYVDDDHLHPRGHSLYGTVLASELTALLR